MKKMNILASIFIVLLLFIMSCSYEEPTGTNYYNYYAENITDIYGLQNQLDSKLDINGAMEALSNTAINDFDFNGMNVTAKYIYPGNQAVRYIYDDTANTRMRIFGDLAANDITSISSKFIGATTWNGYAPNSVKLYSTTSYIFLQTGTTNQPMYFDAGSSFLWRDRDDSSDVAMELDATTGVLYIEGTYEIFDEYDDALLLKQGIGQGDMQKLEQVGIVKKKYKTNETGDLIYTKDNNLIETGYLINVPSLMKLISGGVYQNRDYIESLESRIMALEAKLEVK